MPLHGSWWYSRLRRVNTLASRSPSARSRLGPRFAANFAPSARVAKVRSKNASKYTKERLRRVETLASRSPSARSRLGPASQRISRLRRVLHTSQNHSGVPKTRFGENLKNKKFQKILLKNRFFVKNVEKNLRKHRFALANDIPSSSERQQKKSKRFGLTAARTSALVNFTLRVVGTRLRQ
jgi:hypothetical protein